MQGALLINKTVPKYTYKYTYKIHLDSGDSQKASTGVCVWAVPALVTTTTQITVRLILVF